MEIDITGLKKNNASLLVACSRDLVQAAAAGGVAIRTGTSSGFDSGASDYLALEVHQGADSVAAGSAIALGDFVSGGRTSIAHMAVIVGAPQETITQVIQSQDMTSGLGDDTSSRSGSRELRQVEDRIRLFLGAQDFSGGSEYIVGYSL
jgi:hypothetical protein